MRQPSPFQATLATPVSFQGVGVHTGEEIQIHVQPAPCDTGIVFHRSDLTATPIPATWENVCSTKFCTVIGNELKETVSTVEHLMAAIWEMGLTNLEITIDGPELPVLDGSSLPFLERFLEAGIVQQNNYRAFIQILKTVRIEEGEAFLEISPLSDFSIELEASSGENISQFASYCFSKDSFKEMISPARTFSQLENVLKMKAAGFIKGGSLDNALVFDKGKVINKEGMRLPQECARHKILDFIGDWSLSGAFIFGQVKGAHTGHTLNHMLLKKLMENQDAWVTLSPVNSITLINTPPVQSSKVEGTLYQQAK
eukprot:g8572.t1